MPENENSGQEQEVPNRCIGLSAVVSPGADLLAGGQHPVRLTRSTPVHRISYPARGRSVSTILSFAQGLGQAGYVVLAVFVVAIVIVSIAVFNRRPIEDGDRSTELVVGDFFRLTTKDKAGPRKPTP
jgi:hypothetical protein